MSSNEVGVPKVGGKRHTRKGVKKHHRKVNKTQKGGSYLEMVVDDSIPMGPKGGVMSYVMKQQGGYNHNGICNDIKKVKEFSQVKQFWQSICPGAVMLYQNYLQKLEDTQSKKVKEVVVCYTRAFCEEVKALKCKKPADVEKHLQRLKKHMTEVKKMLRSLNKDSLKHHENIVNMHICNIERYKQRTVIQMKREKTRKNIQKKIKKTYKKLRSKMSRKNMKGGYNQYLSNVPYSAGYELSTNLSANESALANPAPINGHHINNVDNYNHFTLLGTETGVFDSAPQN
jgi:hypothetical protein